MILTNTTSLFPAFAEWSKDNLVAEDLALMVEDLRQGKPKALAELSELLELASRRGGKAFSANVLSTLADALETEIF